MRESSLADRTGHILSRVRLTARQRKGGLPNHKRFAGRQSRLFTLDPVEINRVGRISQLFHQQSVVAQSNRDVFARDSVVPAHRPRLGSTPQLDGGLLG